MSISVNGQSKVPPGFRFHPTEEELLQYYLRKKVSLQNIDLDVIQDVDLNKLEPWDIQEICKIGSTPQNDWYFFSHKDKKYPTGIRTNRATAAGFWKATGRDKVIFSNSRRIGMRKTLVFYKGRAPHGQKSDWIMHEYRLEDNTVSDTDTNTDNVSNIGVVGETTQKEGWVVCRIFKKKNHYKSLDRDHYSPPMNIINASSITTATSRTQFPTNSSSNTNETTCSLDQILHEYMGRSCKVDEDEAKYMNSTGTLLYESDQRFMKLPNLESPNSCRSLSNYYQRPAVHVQMLNNNIQQLVSDHPNSVYDHQSPSELTDLNNWAALDRLVASHLHGQKYYDTITTTTSSSKQQLSCLNDDIDHDPPINFCLSEITNINDLQLQQQLHSSSSYHMLYGNKPHSTTQDEHNSCDQSDLWSLI